MHHIYHTNALVLRHSDTGEANRIYDLYTKEFGLITAIAQGTRRLRSRQRYALQEGSLIKVDLIKGREFWRIGSVSIIGNIFGRTLEWNGIIGKWIRLMSRLIHGEGTHNSLFDDILNTYELSVSNGFVEVREYGVLVLVRTLHILGYWDKNEDDTGILKENILEAYNHTQNWKRDEYVFRINQAMKETQL